VSNSTDPSEINLGLLSKELQTYDSSQVLTAALVDRLLNTHYYQMIQSSNPYRGYIGLIWKKSISLAIHSGQSTLKDIWDNSMIKHVKKGFMWRTDVQQTWEEQALVILFRTFLVPNNVSTHHPLYLCNQRQWHWTFIQACPTCFSSIFVANVISYNRWVSKLL